MDWNKSWVSNDKDDWIYVSEEKENEQKKIDKDEDQADNILESNIISTVNIQNTTEKSVVVTKIKSVAFKTIINSGWQHKMIEIGMRAIITSQNPHNAMILTICLSCYTITMTMYSKNKKNKSNFLRAYWNKTKFKKT